MPARAVLLLERPAAGHRGVKLATLLAEMGVLEEVRAGRFVVLLNGRPVAREELEDIVLDGRATVALLRPAVGG